MTAVVFFNHPLVIEPAQQLPRRFCEIGCNYFTDLRKVDHICAYDPHTAERITPQPNTTYWTRNGHKRPGWDEVCCPIVYNPQDSGTMAIMLAIQLGHKKIYVFGCGWGEDDRSLFDDRYTHRGVPKKCNNGKMKLIQRYQKDFKVDICFACRPFHKGLSFVDYEYLLRTF